VFNCQREPCLYYTQDKDLFREPERAACFYLQVGKIQTSLKLATVQMQCLESHLGCCNPLSYNIISIFNLLCLLINSVDTTTLLSHFLYFLPANCGHLHCVEAIKLFTKFFTKISALLFYNFKDFTYIFSGDNTISGNISRLPA